MRIKKNFPAITGRPLRVTPASGTGAASMERPPRSPQGTPRRSRVESNGWLRANAAAVRGAVLSIGSRDDAEGEGGSYRGYFSSASSYTTSDIFGGADLALDVRDMATIADDRYDGIFCSGVLEHVDDFHRALAEITRILTPAGTLLLGVPFRQAIHDAPGDFWRFTRHAIDYLLRDRYDVLEIREIDKDPGADFPAAYWVKAVKRCAVPVR